MNALIVCLKDTERLVRRDAAQALGKIKNAGAAEALIQCLHDSDEHVKRAAFEALAALDRSWVKSAAAAGGIAMLVRQFIAEDRFVRSVASEMLEQIDPQWRRSASAQAQLQWLIEHGADSKDTSIRETTLALLDQVEPRWRNSPEWINCRRQSGRNAVMLALTLLAAGVGRGAGMEMVRLKSLLTAPDPEFRFGAEDAVRKSGNPAAMALLHQVEDTLRKGVQGGDPKREVDSKSGESVSRRHDANSCVSRRANVASKRIVVQFQPNDGTLERWISEHSSRAKAEALLPCVQFYGDWCGACQKLRASFDHPLMRDAISGTYIMQVDLNANLAEIVALRFDIQSIPIFFILDATGRPTGSKIDGGAWADNIPENMAPPLMAFFKKARAA